MALELQLYMFAAMVVTGVAVAFWYDLYRAARVAFQWQRWLGELTDLLFWLVAAVLLLAGLVVGTWGSFRAYVLLGLLAGLWLYFALAAPLLFPAWLALFRWLDRALAFAGHGGRRAWRLAGDRGRRAWFGAHAVARSGGRRLTAVLNRWLRPRWPWRRPPAA